MCLLTYTVRINSGESEMKCRVLFVYLASLVSEPQQLNVVGRGVTSTTENIRYNYGLLHILVIASSSRELGF